MSHGGAVDSFIAPLVLKTREFQEIVRASQELQHVDLDLLHSDASKLCFYVNVVNLLLAHAYLVNCGCESEACDQEAGILRCFQLFNLRICRN